MTNPTTSPPDFVKNPQPILYRDLPLLYEDEEEPDLGETNPHVIAEEIIRNGLKAHLVGQPSLRVFSNMNLYYSPQDLRAYVSPDTMVVPCQAGYEISSYRIGKDGPAPILVAEILSERSAQQRDLSEKVELYAHLGVAEYILADVTGKFLPQRLLLKRLQPDQTWKDEQDPDGGITSQLGFRLVTEPDGLLRVLDAVTGKRYIRPEEAETRRRQAEERIRELEAELARLRASKTESENP